MPCIFSHILLITLYSILLFSLITCMNSSFNDVIEESIAQKIFQKNNGSFGLRKCCPHSTYFSTISNDCHPDISDYFNAHINKHLNPFIDVNFFAISGKIEICPNSSNLPLIHNFPTHFSHSLLQNGSLADIESNHTYSINHYCLEIIGNKPELASLVLVHCPGIRNNVHKCCPRNHYFDSRISGCSPYFFIDGTAGDEAIAHYLTSDQHLTYEYELTCEDPPVKMNLMEGFLDHEKLCVYSMDYCFPSNMYCIDNMLLDEESTLIQSAFICPVHFINKCCPKDQILNSTGCVNATNVSIFLSNIIENTRYHIKNLNYLKSKCVPLLLEESKNSSISWELDSKGSVIIKREDINITLVNYCIDDFRTEEELFPVLKICNEDLNEYPEVSKDDRWLENAIGKCCPLDMISQSNTGNEISCIYQRAGDSSLLNISDRSTNISNLNLTQLVYTNFPSCSNPHSYHFYPLENHLVDHAEITSDRDVIIVSIERNKCRARETKVPFDNFCIEMMLSDASVILPIVVICSEMLEEKHDERNPIIISLVLLSCVALFVALITIVWSRVRRGMVTVKKINTLAGRLLLSYIFCQLIGFLALSVGIIVDFEQENNSCFVLGILMFFLISAFCWNTSICVEGLLLTLHIRIAERHRFAYHMIWAVGFPSTITSLALFQDSRRDQLPCNAITPKFGDQRCFFSDTLAQLLFFYLPISITVILNAILLITAKFLRHRKLKELEKDPRRIRRHGALKKVLAISMSTKERIQKEKCSKPPDPMHSGLRTHQNRNLLLESSKLVLWSGGTWLMEVVGALVTHYVGPSQGEWYNYIWYLPVGFNSLRGIGIFMIISLTSESKSKFARTFTLIGSSLNRTFTSIVSSKSFKSKKDTHRKSSTGLSDACNSINMNKNSISYDTDGCLKKHRVSISTVITEVSFPNYDEDSKNHSIRNKEFYRSISEAQHTQSLSQLNESNENVSVTHLNSSFNQDDVFAVDEESYCTHL